MATIAEKLAEAAVTDSLIGAENPLSNGGKWTLPSWDTVIGQKTATGWQPNTAYNEPKGDGARWGTVQPSGSYLYAIVELNSYRVVKTGELIEQNQERWWGVLACLPAEAESGYRVRAEKFGEGGNRYKIKLEKLTAGSVELLGEKEVELEGTKEPAVAVVVGEGFVYAYYKKEKGSAWTQAVEAESTTYTEGRSAIECKGNFFRGQNFRTGTFDLEEEPGVMNPRAASATASALSPTLVTPIMSEAASAEASMPAVELVGGAMPSPSEHEPGGLPLPFPSVLANPARLGPSRFTALERKTLGIKE